MVKRQLRNPTASEMGKKGGKTRIAGLTKEQRQELARKAAQARWARVRAKKKQVKEP